MIDFMEKPMACPITTQSYHQAAHVLGRAFVDDPVSVVVYQKFSTERRVRCFGQLTLSQKSRCGSERESNPGKPGWHAGGSSGDLSTRCLSTASL